MSEYIEYVRICEIYKKTYQNISANIRISQKQNRSGNIKIYESVSDYNRIFHNTSRYIIICQNISDYS